MFKLVSILSVLILESITSFKVGSLNLELSLSKETVKELLNSVFGVSLWDLPDDIFISFLYILCLGTSGVFRVKVDFRFLLEV